MRPEFLIASIFSFTEYSISIALPLYLIYLGFSTFEIGYLFSIAVFSNIILRFLLSILADKIGTRYVFLLSITCKIIAYFGYSISKVFWQFAIFLFFSGIGTSSFWSVIRTNIYKYRDSKVKLMSKNWAIISISGTIGLFFSGFLIKIMGYQNTFLLLLTFLLPFLIIVRKIRNFKLEERRETVKIPISKIFWKASIINSLYGFMIPFYDSFFQVILDKNGFNEISIGISFAISELLFAVLIIKSLNLSFQKINILGIVFSLISIPFIFFGFPLMILILVFTYMGDSFRTILFERNFAIGIKKVGISSFKIFILTLPFLISSLLSRYLYPAIGLENGFILASLILAIFSYLARTL